MCTESFARSQIQILILNKLRALDPFLEKLGQHSGLRARRGRRRTASEILSTG
jgi:hypothetical protein